jgi:hypothetical protein
MGRKKRWAYWMNAVRIPMLTTVRTTWNESRFWLEKSTATLLTVSFRIMSFPPNQITHAMAVEERISTTG